MKKELILSVLILLVFIISGCSEVLQNSPLAKDKSIKKTTTSCLTYQSFNTEDVFALTNDINNANNICSGDKIDLLTLRKNLLVDLIENNPSESLTVPELDSGIISTLTKEEKNDLVEKRGNFKGYLEVVAVDDFENPENSGYEYWININNIKDRLYIENEEYPNLISGIKTSFYGMELEGVIAAVNLNLSEFNNLKDFNLGENKLLVLIGEYDNYPFGYDPEIIEEKVFGRESSLNTFFVENSNNQSWFSGEVVGPLYLGSHIPDSSPLIRNDFMNVADNYINFTEYKRVMYIVGYPFAEFLYPPHATTGYNEEVTQDGKVNLSWSMYVISRQDNFSLNNSPRIEYTFAHEVGHNFGAFHSNSLDCNYHPFYQNPTDCVSIEYGNMYSVMGSALFGGHFTTTHKKIFGWLNTTNYLEIQTPGIYEITPLEFGNGVKELIFPYKGTLPSYKGYILNESFYSIGYRTKPINSDDSDEDFYNQVFDSDGVFINLIQTSHENFDENPVYPNIIDYLIDTHPYTIPEYYYFIEDAALNVGDIYYDTNEGTYIKVLFLNETLARLYIDLNYSNISIKSTCGNSILESGEQCDPNSDSITKTCFELVEYPCENNGVLYVKAGKELPKNIDWNDVYDKYKYWREAFDLFYGDIIGCYELYGFGTERCNVRNECVYKLADNNCRICQSKDYLEKGAEYYVSNESECKARFIDINNESYWRDIKYTNVIDEEQPDDQPIIKEDPVFSSIKNILQRLKEILF